MERKINIVHYVLLVLSLGMVAGSMALHRGPSPFLSGGDPTQVTHPALARAAQGIPVKVTTPSGTRWKYMDLSEGTSLAEFLNNMGEDLFGKAAYAASARVAQGFPRLDRGPAALPAGPREKPQGRTAGPALQCPSSRHPHSPASLSAGGRRKLKEFPAVRCGRGRLSRPLTRRRRAATLSPRRGPGLFGARSPARR